ncbi:uncharacterized protein LOC128951477 [Oppia nitens]|uniref:uncharacterized protein LOC128951477 n=1 Tax=Oppia nitens TaxID=1686743 RepID=UPI0023DA93A5|nr:uncharacterized protein LOC128951477 [Oppia nitens]
MADKSYDYWDDNDDDSTYSLDDSSEIPQPMSSKELHELSPDKMAANEKNNESAIIKQTINFGHQLKQCEAIVSAAYRVADYVPEIKNAEQSKFWKETIIPILVDSLKQDVLARSVITSSFAAVRDLTITIQKVYEIVKFSKGSQAAIAVAKKNIPQALSRLNQCIERAKQLDSNAINIFGEQTTKIFHIIGPEAAKFAEEKAKKQHEINKYFDDKNKLIYPIAQLTGDIEKYNHLINATNKYLGRVESELDETKRRTEEMYRLKREAQESIQNIPDTIIVPEQQTESKSFLGIKWWSKTSTIYVEDSNPHKHSDLRHYENAVRVHADQLKANQSVETGKQLAMERLSADKANYEKQLMASCKQLQQLNADLPKQTDSINKQINKLYEEIDDLDRDAFEAYSKYGLQGNTLVDCLINVRTFAKSIKPGATAYSPLHSILTAIKAIVETYVDFLGSGEEKYEIFMAGQLLMRQVEFLSNYNLLAIDTFAPSDQYNRQSQGLDGKITMAIMAPPK